MSVTVICPNLRCRCMLQVPNDVRGKKVRCAKCGKNFIVPVAEKPRKRRPPADESPTPEVTAN